MKIEKITNDNFKTEVLQSEMSVLVDFYADWCGPCKMLAPIVDEIAQENDDIKVAKVNVDENPNIALDYKVMSIPTLVVIKGGKEVSRSVGVVDKKEIIYNSKKFNIDENALAVAAAIYAEFAVQFLTDM